MSACKDIKPGEELLASYLGELCLPRAERQAALHQQGFPFVCQCTVCTASPDQVCVSASWSIAVLRCIASLPPAQLLLKWKARMSGCVLCVAQLKQISQLFCSRSLPATGGALS